MCHTRVARCVTRRREARRHTAPRPAFMMLRSLFRGGNMGAMNVLDPNVELSAELSTIGELLRAGR